MTKVGIAIDQWKLLIFTRRLQEVGYVFENLGEIPGGALLLRVNTANVEALGEVIKAANQEAARTGKTK